MDYDAWGGKVEEEEVRFFGFLGLRLKFVETE